MPDGYHLPFEEIPKTDQDIVGYMMDSLDLKSGVVDTELGKLPVLVFQFRNSSKSQEIPPVMLVTSSAVMANVASMVQKAVVAARKAAR